MATQFFVRYDWYLARAIKEMATDLEKANISPQHTLYLMVAANTACLNLTWLLNDEKFARDVEKIYSSPATLQHMRDFPGDFWIFLQLERDLLLQVGIPSTVTDEVIERCRGLLERKGSAKDVMEAVNILHDKSCNAFHELQDEQAQSRADEEKQQQKQIRLHRIMLGISGTLLVGLGVVLPGIGLPAAVAGFSLAGGALLGQLGIGLIQETIIEIEHDTTEPSPTSPDKQQQNLSERVHDFSGNTCWCGQRGPHGGQAR